MSSQSEIDASILAGWKSIRDSLEFTRYMAGENRGITFDACLNAHQDGRAAASAFALNALDAKIKELEESS